MSAAKVFAMFQAFGGLSSAHVSSAHRQVLTALANYEHECSDGSDGRQACPAGCDRAGLAWPSLGTIVTFTGLCKGTVKEILADLRGGGWVEVEPRHDDDGGQTSNFYRIRTVGEQVGATSKRGGRRVPASTPGAEIGPRPVFAPPPGQSLPLPPASLCPSPRVKD